MFRKIRAKIPGKIIDDEILLTFMSNFVIINPRENQRVKLTKYHKFNFMHKCDCISF